MPSDCKHEGSSALVAEEKQCRRHLCGRQRLHPQALKGTRVDKGHTSAGAGGERLRRVGEYSKSSSLTGKLVWWAVRSLTGRCVAWQDRLDPCVLDWGTGLYTYTHGSTLTARDHCITV